MSKIVHTSDDVLQMVVLVKGLFSDADITNMVIRSRFTFLQRQRSKSKLNSEISPQKLTWVIDAWIIIFGKRNETMAKTF